jgi:hypothetical protein
MNNAIEKVENNVEINEKEMKMKEILYKVRPVFKQYIKDNSKPAPKDETYGNKLRSFLNEYDFAVYALFRNTDFSKGLHSDEKATEVATTLSTRSKFQNNSNYQVNRSIDSLALGDILSEDEISELKEYAVSYFEKWVN